MSYVGRCPFCGREATVASPVADEGHEHMPAAGDVSLCFGCGRPGIFTGRGLEVREPTRREYDDAAALPEVRDWLRAWREHHGQGGA